MQRPSLEYAQRPVDVYRSNPMTMNPFLTPFTIWFVASPHPPPKKENMPTTTKWGLTLYSQCLLVKYPNGHGLLQRLHPSSISNHLVKRPSHWKYLPLLLQDSAEKIGNANPANDCYCYVQSSGQPDPNSWGNPTCWPQSHQICFYLAIDELAASHAQQI